MQEAGYTPIFFRKRKLLILILFFLTLIVYANAIPADFVWDDQTIVLRNEAIKNFKHIPYIFTNEFAEKANYNGNIYRPAQEFSYMVDYFLWGFDPAGFHVTNVLLFIGCVISLFYLVLNITGSPIIAFITSAVFGVHPINTEAVTYISGRSDPLYFLFLTLSFLLYIKSAKRRLRRGYMSALLYAFSLVFYITALFSRETAIMFPFLLFSYEAFITGEKPIKRAKVFPFFAILLLYALARIKLIPLDTGKVVFLNFNIVFFTGIKVIAEYIRILFFPFGLHMERWIPLSRGMDPSVITAFLIVLPFAVSSFFIFRKRKDIFFWIVWFVIFLAPHLNVLRLNALYAEHWICAGAVGMYALLAYLLYGMIEKGGLPRKLSYLCLAGTIAYLAPLTVMRNLDWRDEPSIYLDTLEHTASPKVMSNLGVYYSMRKEHDKAIEIYKKALEISPNETWYHNNIAASYYNKGDAEKAAYHWRKSLSINPNQEKIREFLSKCE